MRERGGGDAGRGTSAPRLPGRVGAGCAFVLVWAGVTHAHKRVCPCFSRRRRRGCCRPCAAPRRALALALARGLALRPLAGPLAELPLLLLLLRSLLSLLLPSLLPLRAVCWGQTWGISRGAQSGQTLPCPAASCPCPCPAAPCPCPCPAAPLPTGTALQACPAPRRGHAADLWAGGVGAGGRAEAALLAARQARHGCAGGACNCRRSCALPADGCFRQAGGRLAPACPLPAEVAFLAVPHTCPGPPCSLSPMAPNLPHSPTATPYTQRSTASCLRPPPGSCGRCAATRGVRSAARRLRGGPGTPAPPCDRRSAASCMRACCLARPAVVRGGLAWRGRGVTGQAGRARRRCASHMSGSASEAEGHPKKGAEGYERERQQRQRQHRERASRGGSKTKPGARARGAASGRAARACAQ